MLQKQPPKTWKRFFDIHGILVITTVLCIGFSCIELFFIVSWIMYSQKEIYLRKEGNAASGKIVSLRLASDSSARKDSRGRGVSFSITAFSLSSKHYFPTVEFVDQMGCQHRFESPFSQPDIQVGNTVKLFYLPKDPSNVLIDGAAKWTYHPLNFVLITVCWLFAVFCGYGGIRTYCLERFYNIPVLKC